MTVPLDCPEPPAPEAASAPLAEPPSRPASLPHLGIHSPRAGFTLIELSVALAITALISLLAFDLCANATLLASRQNRKSQTADELAAANSFLFNSQVVSQPYMHPKLAFIVLSASGTLNSPDSRLASPENLPPALPSEPVTAIAWFESLDPSLQHWSDPRGHLVLRMLIVDGNSLLLVTIKPAELHNMVVNQVRPENLLALATANPDLREDAEILATLPDDLRPVIVFDRLPDQSLQPRVISRKVPRTRQRAAS